MNYFKVCFASLLLAATTSTAFAGGILTNTNQSIDFLRNPARDAAIGLDGVYSNPAGVAFMPEGFHLGLNWQYAHQTRTVTATNDLFKLGAKNNGQSTKTFEGVADAPVIPSVQAAYNTGNWSFQFNFSIPGGGGKCEFDKGVGSFETAVGAIAQYLGGTSQKLNAGLQGVSDAVPTFNTRVPAVTGYDVDGYMRGRQYYFGVQLGAARKINENLSVYGGLRLLYGSARYEARLNNIRVMNGTNPSTLTTYFEQTVGNLLNAKPTIQAVLGQVQNGIDQYVAGYKAAGMTEEQARSQKAVVELQEKADGLNSLLAAPDQLTAAGEVLSPYAKNGMNLKSDQTGWGIAPVIGVDYKLGDFNFAAKYEFKTRMRMKNNSDLESAMIPATAKYVDGTSVPEDAPALLTLGAEWSVLDNVRLDLGYHHFFDKQAHWYENSQKLLDGGTDEYLGGVEWDVLPRLTVSAGGQLTRYDLTDAYMNDMSFVVNSYSFGFGLNYKLSNVVSLKAAYFQTNYEDYDMDTPAQNMEINKIVLGIPAGHNTFTRTNRVLGLGCEITL
ncbi:transporter [Prevotella sp. E9-3]|uniref:transporter n=1 Tax=Prevotella sp. E9-3 TaxID=2913621 RepID=UPI001EDB12D3|nr:transporter [Prevotella sp. E9-3]UKK47923.1 transporter [Prevotella sp. E9-3]